MGVNVLLEVEVYYFSETKPVLFFPLGVIYSNPRPYLREK